MLETVVDRLLSAEGLMLGAAALITGLVLTRLRSFRRARSDELEQLRVEKTRAETQAREQMRMVARLRADERTVASLVRFLPSVVRELNMAHLDPNRVPNLIVQLATAIFEPEQVLLFLYGAPGAAKQDTALRLRAHHGLSKIPHTASVIALGAGKIGWVAEHRIEMATEDWLNFSRTEGNTVAHNHPSFHLDLIAPLVHHSDKQEELLGVLCVGKSSARPRDPKLMIQMVTNLGSLALMNSYNLRQLREQANNDGLTGLTNKRAFLEQLGILMTTAEREARKASVFIFDIDHFKHYNDTNGHMAGDDLLKTLARVVRDKVRPVDMLARYGGEEFIVAMPDVDAAEALSLAERIREAVASYPFQHGETQPHGRISISGGVASFPMDGSSGNDLIKNADQALYQAKEAGRNRVGRYRGVNIGDAPSTDPAGWPGSGRQAG